MSRAQAFRCISVWFPAGFRSLYEDGLLKVEAGETSLEEVLRVTRAA